MCDNCRVHATTDRLDSQTRTPAAARRAGPVVACLDCRLLVDKRVDFFLLAYEEGNELDFDPREVYRAAWFPWDEALSRITFENERRVVRAARKLLNRLAAGEPAGEER